MGNRLVFDRLAPGREIELRFPMVRTVERYTYRGETYRCAFRGNTLVDISPRDDAVGYPIYRRAYYNRDEAPLVEARRYATDLRIRW